MLRSTLVLIALTAAPGTLLRAADNPIPEEFRKALEKAETLELYSLDPSTPVEKGDAEFHGWKMLGKTEVKKESLTKLVVALKKGAEEADQRVAAGCFHPRHGIRVQLDGKSYDFVICFECVAVMLYKDKDEKSTKGFHVSDTPADIFNTILKDAKVKLPAQPEK
jgi:uncharacterized radical SAM superfamily protein